MASQISNRRPLTLRFTLRSLLAFMLIAACAFGWLAAESRRAKAQKETVATIRRAGGRVVYVDGGSAWWGKRFVREILGDEVFRRVDRVSFHHARDADLETISRLADLGDLRLNSRSITDSGLTPLSRLKQLERLDLWCENLTDESVHCLAGLDRLETLDLYGAQITDAGLDALRGLHGLRLLKLRGTRVTPSGVARLQQLLPDCRIEGVKPAQVTPSLSLRTSSCRHRGLPCFLYRILAGRPPERLPSFGLHSLRHSPPSRDDPAGVERRLSDDGAFGPCEAHVPNRLSPL